jgi:hypothetical protein
MGDTMMDKVDAYFKMSERKTNFSQEFRGGVATFLVSLNMSSSPTLMLTRTRARPNAPSRWRAGDGIHRRRERRHPVLQRYAYPATPTCHAIGRPGCYLGLVPACWSCAWAPTHNITGNLSHR